MTDVTITGVTATTGTAYAPAGTIRTRAKGVALDFWNSDGEQIPYIYFESLYPGMMAVEQPILVNNNGTENLTITLGCVASDINPQGTSLDTYLSTYFSTDQINYYNSLDVNLVSEDSETVYIRYNPPSTATSGEKQWTLKPTINDVVSGSPPGFDTHRDWQYYDYFTVTGGDLDSVAYPITLTLDYAVDVMNTDFSDIRFIDEDGLELGYYIVSKTDSSTATFLIELNSYPLEDESVNVFVYAGNPNASTTSSTGSVDTWTDAWTLNDTDYPHDTSYYDDGEFNIPNQRIILCDGDYDGGNAVNSGTLTDSFIFQADVDLGYEQFALFFYLEDINNYIVVQRLKKVNFGHYWEIGKVVNGTYTALATNLANPYDDAYYTGALRIEVVKNTSIKIYQGATLKLTYTGTFPQSGGGYGFNAVNRHWSGNYGRCYIDQPLFSLTGSFEQPTVGVPTGTWKFLSNTIEIKAGILYQTKDLPELEPEIRYGCRIGGVYYE